MSELQLDNRGLDHPEPLLRILDALPRLADGDVLVAQMDREPLLLYPILEKRGFDWTIDEQPGGEYLVRIQRASF